jgi:hypothetical protein
VEPVDACPLNRRGYGCWHASRCILRTAAM